MTVTPRATTRVSLVLLVASILGACVAQSPSATAPSAGPPTANAPVPSDPPGSPEPGAAGIGPGTRTACLSLDIGDCARARDLAGSVLTADDPAPIYVQVGPFGCAAGGGCPPTLDARPEGDVVVEFPGGDGINVHIRMAPDGTADVSRDAAMGVPVEPSSSGPIVAGPMPFTLGHCGIFSGIDIDGDWWDPVGPVDADSGDSVNATSGVITFADPTHGLFVAPSGFSLLLERRSGPKLLPFCM